MRTRPPRWPAALIALTAWFGLALQFYLMVTGTLRNKDPLGPAMLHFFLYFTILNNLLVALVSTTVTFRRSSPAPAVTAATAIYIAVVGGGYSLLLRHLYHPTGLGFAADEIVHDIIPCLYVFWWIFLADKARLAWSNTAIFLIWPLCYLAAAITYGVHTGWYPYPFLDIAKLGYPAVIRISIAFTIAFALLSAIAVAWSRFTTRQKASRTAEPLAKAS